jgi:hypothetical protein
VSSCDVKNFILLADKPSRTPKYMYALASGIPILDFGYVEECLTQDKLLDFTPFLLSAGPSQTLKKEVAQP